MFGHQNNDQANPSHIAPTADDALSGPEPETISPASASSAPPVDNAIAYAADLPHIDPATAEAQTPVVVAPPVVAAPAPTITPTVSLGHNPGEVPSDLLELKQSALHELSPLVGHLEQTPEEKFRTTMMMIQASDDQSMLQAAFEAAKHITDEKARAQALLDVINEINYFTQQHND